ncbi:MAG: hypothetical protein RR703_04165 [Bacilli bacterium]
MVKEKFEMVLQKDEEIKWSNKVNVIANVLKGLIPALLGGVIGLFGILFFGGMSIFYGYGFDENLSRVPDFIPILIILLVILLCVIVLCYIIYVGLNNKNTYFAITNKRIIKRTGAFNNNFIHYTLKNVGTVQVVGGVVDRNDSATLLITTKDFHTDSKGNTHADRLKVSSLCNAYEAYNMLSELVEGNNETLNVQIEK